MNNGKKLVYMLMVDQDDKFITSSTLKELQQDLEVRYVSGPDELFAALKKQTPSIILVDANISPQPGLEILRLLKSGDDYNAIPVIILTDSPIRKFHAQCYAAGACSVIRKPDSMQSTTHKISTFFEYWLNVAET